eukprot:TRINITY_DN2207_c0_g1_i3.p1 TRINITY_DN2207_c0_g1~~TRINITY_DN2207_c0_g1_i3.p1  ORF type:complete len:1079 (+),score=269.96 TRINITY_DN2207_c0_g1_i3:39-3275(+)
MPHRSDEEHRTKKRKKDRADKSHKKQKKRTNTEKILEIEKKFYKHEQRKESGIIWTNDDDSTSKDIMIYDTKGDMNNAVFLCLFRLDVPIYYRQHYCLGYPPHEKIIFKKEGYQLLSEINRSTSTTSILRNANRFNRKDVVKNMKRITLTNHNKERKSFPERSNDFLPIFAEKDDEEGETPVEALHRRTKEYNVKLRESPKDVDLWLEFINFQDESLSFGSRQEKSLGAITEKKIAIFLKALEHNPRNEQLLLGYLRACEQVWEPEKVLTAWERVIDNNNTNIRLWNNFFSFRQTNFASFSVSSIRTTYISCIQTLNAEKNSLKRKSPEATKKVEKEILELFYRLCAFEKQTGYTERALSYFQGQIEFNCFRPVGVTDSNSLISFFKVFWETESPRIGHHKSKGWAEWYRGVEEGLKVSKEEEKEEATWSSDGNESGPAKPSFEPERNVNGEDSDSEAFYAKQPFHLINKWVNYEIALSAHNIFPASTFDDIGSDAERVVLYDDIHEVLFDVVDESLKEELLQMFLDFLGIRFEGGHSTNEEFIKNRVCELPDFRLLTSDQYIYSDNVLPEHIPFVRNLLSQGLRAYPRNINLILASVHFEAKLDIEKGLAQCKAFLQTDSTNMRLWLAYAEMEEKKGNLTQAKKIYDRALSFYGSLGREQKQEAFRLFRAYVQLSLRSADPPLPLLLHILVSAAEGSFTSVQGKEVDPPSKTRIVKARNFYDQKVRTGIREVSGNGWFVDMSVCGGLLEYVLNIDRINKHNYSDGLRLASEAFEVSLKSLSQFPPLHELLTLQKVKFMLEGAEKHQTPPFVVREVLEDALTQYPRNPLLLLLFIKSQETSKIQNRLRRFFDQICEKEESPVLWAFAIASEQEKLGSHNRIIMLFEKALHSPGSNKAHAIWQSYFHYHIVRREWDAAKRIYFRGLKEVPWSKTFWLEGLSFFSGLPLDPNPPSDALPLSPKNLLSLMELLHQKELRLCQQINEISVALESFLVSNTTLHSIIPKDPQGTPHQTLSAPSSTSNLENSFLYTSPEAMAQQILDSFLRPDLRKKDVVEDSLPLDPVDPEKVAYNPEDDDSD